MSAPQGWYDAGVPGRQRWWDGTQWTAHERDAQPLAPALPLRPAMGWYPVPGTADVRWWDGVMWTPYRIRTGRPRADALAVEPPALGLTAGILLLAAGLLQLVTGLLTRSPGFSAPPVLLIVAGGLWIAGSIHSIRVRSLPGPQSAAIVDATAQPLPGEVEGPGAGWYPMTSQVTRWWTGARWSWYIGTKYGPRPGYAGPRGYLVSMIMGWVLVGAAVIGLVMVGIGIALGDGAGGFLIVIALVLTLVIGGLAVFVLLITRWRRNAMLLPKTPPPVRR